MHVRATDYSGTQEIVGRRILTAFRHEYVVVKNPEKSHLGDFLKSTKCKTMKKYKYFAELAIEIEK